MEPPEPIAAEPSRWVVIRVVELGGIFVLAPSLLACFMKPWMVFPAIWLLGAICLVVLLRDRSFERRRLWNAGGVRNGLGRILFCFALGVPLLGAGLLAYQPDRLFSLPRQNTALWAIIMVAYPILSVYAQELAFRAFFFHRYAGIFPSRAAMVLASAAAFAYAHIILHNWFAVAFSIVGGMLFAHTYARTRSLLACCLEHALYGCYIFTIGWGSYFYGGSLSR